MIVVPYKIADGRDYWHHKLTLLPEKLTIDGQVIPQQRRRGLFAVTVYTATVDVVAEFPVKALRDLQADNRTHDWASARLDLGLSDPKSIDNAGVAVEGQPLEWTTGSTQALASLQAPLRAIDLASRDTVTVRLRIAFGGSGSLAFAPIGRRTEVSLASPWPSPGFSGRHLPASHSIDRDGFSAKWSISNLSRRYGQLWDSGGRSEPAAEAVIDSAFGVMLVNPVDAYRETDRAIKYGIMFIGLTFAACLLFEFATGIRAHAAQYGLIGLSLCVFYLLLLSFAEHVGFGPAYLVSAAAVAAQASVYNWMLHRRRRAALAFGAILAGLFAGLYALLQLEDVALLTGSLVLFAVLSLAMWFTRNLHRTRPA
jgi:inner membrane protein